MDKLSIPAMTCILALFCLAAATAALAQRPGAAPAQGPPFTTLVTFNGTDGSNPYAVSLVQGTDGAFYGTTQYGGANNNSCTYGCGTVFKVTSGGTLTSLYSFCSQPNCTDGSSPWAGLVLATDGNFYGTTLTGGAYQGGTVFRITPNGDLTTVYNFCSQPDCTDGGTPAAALMQAADGNLYGSTVYGWPYNMGTIFKITLDGTLTTLYVFGSGDDGAYPTATLVQGKDGNFYGSTLGDGLDRCYEDWGCGSIFRITPSGELTTLYFFCSELHCSDGSQPYSALMPATDGNFYGTTSMGGAYDNCGDPGWGAHGCGTIFRITADGTLTTLHSFDGSSGDYPIGALLQARDGNLYGTASGSGQENSDGTVFTMTLGGATATLHRFNQDEYPFGGLVEAADGSLYGTTAASTYGDPAGGTVYRIGRVGAGVAPCAICRGH